MHEDSPAEVDQNSYGQEEFEVGYDQDQSDDYSGMADSAANIHNEMIYSRTAQDEESAVFEEEENPAGSTKTQPLLPFVGPGLTPQLIIKNKKRRNKSVKKKESKEYQNTIMSSPQ